MQTIEEKLEIMTEAINALQSDRRGTVPNTADDSVPAFRPPKIITVSSDLSCWDFSRVPNLENVTISEIIELPKAVYANSGSIVRVKLSDGKSRTVKGLWKGNQSKAGTPQKPAPVASVPAVPTAATGAQCFKGQSDVDAAFGEIYRLLGQVPKTTAATVPAVEAVQQFAEGSIEKYRADVSVRAEFPTFGSYRAYVKRMGGKNLSGHESQSGNTEVDRRGNAFSQPGLGHYAVGAPSRAALQAGRQKAIDREAELKEWSQKWHGLTLRERWRHNNSFAKYLVANGKRYLCR